MKHIALHIYTLSVQNISDFGEFDISYNYESRHIHSSKIRHINPKSLIF